jgi:hypothetical protein
MTRALVLAAIAAATLAAGGAEAQPRGQQPPPGNYFQTCRNVSTDGYGPNATMTAECRDRNGRWRRSSLRFAGCDRIENREGVLSCRPGGGYPPPRPGPPVDADGGGRASLTLYANPDFGGRPFQASGEITNLPREYNDRAMSLRIEGRRAWQVCTDSDFRGRCQVFDRDVRDLRQAGLGGQVSSLRPFR